LGATLHAAEIHEAAVSGNLERVKACLSRDQSQINVADAKGRSVLACAVLSGKKELVEFLIRQGATEDISAAAVTGHSEKIAELLKQDPTLVNARATDDKTPLHWAAFHGQRKVAELLLAEKADINALDEGGFAPLHWAAMFNRSEVVEVLLANKANFKIKVAKFGWTPMRLAVIHGHVATAEMLVKAGADVNAQEEDEIPLLLQAVYSGRKEMVEFLLARRADANARDYDADTALFEALEHGNKDIADLLRRHGAREK
jgi:cytohesin